MNNLVYWIWLQERAGFGSRAVSRVIEMVGGARQLYDMSEREIGELGIFHPKRLRFLADKDLTEAQRTMDSCERLGYDIITPYDWRYPRRLLNIAAPPVALYVQGELPDIDNEVCVGIVGTRNASEHGSLVARELALRLSDAGCVIISGGAKGIDTAAHTGAIVAGGRTVSVLGCGIDYRYNMENRPLRDKIARTCALISEFPPGSAPLASHFPIRNRIIAGLSLGVVVVEGSTRSGSVITADLANEQGKDVFAIPGQIGAINAQCVNKLLQQGAKALTCPMDVLAEYAPAYPHKLKLEGADVPLLHDYREQVGATNVRGRENTSNQPVQGENNGDMRREPDAEEDIFAQFEKRSAGKIHDGKRASDEPVKSGEKLSPAQEKLPEGLSDGAKELYALISGQPIAADSLSSQMGRSISDILRLLTELELWNLVRSHPGQRYSR